MSITSSVFKQGEEIPSKYTCDGKNINPPLEIKDIPKEAKSLVLIIDDPDAPGGTFLHWLVFNISPETQVIKENTIPLGAQEGKNSFRRIDYGGPCPPSGVHHYFFRLYALDKWLRLAKGSNLETVKKAMEGHILCQTELMGIYKRK